jgi:hypothetical protein
MPNKFQNVKVSDTTGLIVAVTADYLMKKFSS